MALSVQDRNEISKLIRETVRAEVRGRTLEAGRSLEERAPALVGEPIPIDISMQDLDTLLGWLKEKLPTVADQCCNGCD